MTTEGPTGGRAGWLQRKHGHAQPNPRTKLDLWADKVIGILDGVQTGQHTHAWPDQATANEARKALRRAARRAGVSDVRVICEALGIGRMAMWGLSGGGPMCLPARRSCQTWSPRRRSLASLAPYDADGLDWLSGFSQEAIDEARLKPRPRPDELPRSPRYADVVIAPGRNSAQGTVQRRRSGPI